MATTLLRNTCLVVLISAGLGDPSPGRIPKVYNALITSNQNLEPSKAYPVYQPLLHNTFPYPFHTVYYGDYPVGNSLLPVPGLLPNVPNPAPTQKPETPSSEGSKESEASTATPQSTDKANSPPNPSENAIPAPAPPKTESPIPLNEFGLPPQVLPIGRLGPTYELTHFGSFPYAYPGVRFYDPYDPFGFNPYAGLPLYRPFTSGIGHGAPVIFSKTETSTSAPVAAVAPKAQESQNPPSEPTDLNHLNYAAKDPAIPNVPPPPIPSGGSKADKSK